MIKHKLLIAALLLAAALVPSAATAGRISIELGDRPFYRGATYWDRDFEMIWVPGHWSRHHHEWIHGHYLRSNRRHLNRDFRDDRREFRDERRDDRRFDDSGR